MLTIKNQSRKPGRGAGDAVRRTSQSDAVKARKAEEAAVLLPVLADPKREGENRRTVSADFWPKLRKAATLIPFAKEAAAAFFALTDTETPKRNKLLLLAALAYFVTPMDAIPDFLLALGFSDDAAVFWAAWALTRDTIKPAHIERAEATLSEMQNDHPRV